MSTVSGKKCGCLMRWLKYAVAFLIPVILLMLHRQTLDSDSWYVLAEGREIVQNGIYYTDTLSMHEGLNVTVQNYGFAVIFWLVYSAFGPIGLYLGMLALNFGVCLLLFKIFKLLSNKNENLSLLLMVATDCLLVSIGFVTTRAQMLSYIFFLGVIYILELYIKTGKNKYLWWMPVISLLLINLHASVWWMIFLVLGAYMVDAFKKPKLHLQGYRIMPLAWAGLVSFVVGFLNPYGVKMILFIFSSYGDATMNKLIRELASFNMREIFFVFFYVALVGVLVLLIYSKNKKIRVRHMIMLFGFLALGLNTVKGLSQCVMVLFLPIATAFETCRTEGIIESLSARKIMMQWASVITICVTGGVLVPVLGGLSNYPSTVYANAMDSIDEQVGNERKDEIKLYSGFNHGGYAEFRGYKPYLDPRAEVFIKKNNGKEDVLKEWADLREGRIKTSDFLDKYSFDYLLLEEDDYLLFEYIKDNGSKFELVFEDSEGSVWVYKNVVR